MYLFSHPAKARTEREPMIGGFSVLIFGWLVFIGCAYCARSVYKTSREGESFAVYVLMAVLGAALVAVMSKELFAQEIILTVGVNALFVVIAILVIPAKRAIVRSIDLHHEQ